MSSPTRQETNRSITISPKEWKPTGDREKTLIQPPHNLKSNDIPKNKRLRKPKSIPPRFSIIMDSMMFPRTKPTTV